MRQEEVKWIHLAYDRNKELVVRFFCVFPRRLSAKSRRFGTLYRFHLHRQVDKV